MTSTVAHTAIALFVRQPVPGRVKTRLARDLGDAAACSLYCAMVADVLGQVRDSGLPLYLFHDKGDVADLPPYWRSVATAVVSQRGESLGERMTWAFHDLFAAGFERVMIVGSDIPGITAQVLRDAAASLETSQLVIVPAVDGGYCLIGSRRDCFKPTVLHDIPWSTSHVLKATLDVCSAERITVGLLDSLQDLDTVSDLMAYCQEPVEQARETANWLAEHGYERTSVPLAGATESVTHEVVYP